MLSLTYSAEVFGNLTFHALFGGMWAIPFLIWLEITDVSRANKWTVWAVTTLLLSYPSGKHHFPMIFQVNAENSASNPSWLEFT